MNKTYENGMICECGPPMRAGAYDNWNWCAPCRRIYDKDHKRCPRCNQSLRWKSRGNSKWGRDKRTGQWSPTKKVII